MDAKECSSVYNKGKELYKKGVYKEALKVFSKIETDCVGNFDESIIHHYSALCHSQLRRFKESMREFDLAIKYRPNYGKIYLDKGKTYFFFYEQRKLSELILRFFKRKNNLEKALETFRKGILVDVENTELWYYKGYMLELMGWTDRAERAFKKAIELDRKIVNLENSELFGKIRRKGKKKNSSK